MMTLLPGPQRCPPTPSPSPRARPRPTRAHPRSFGMSKMRPANVQLFSGLCVLVAPAAPRPRPRRPVSLYLCSARCVSGICICIWCPCISVSQYLVGPKPSDLCPRPPTTFHHRDDRERSTSNNNCQKGRRGSNRNNNNFQAERVTCFTLFLGISKTSPRATQLAQRWKIYRKMQRKMQSAGERCNWLIWPTPMPMREDDKSNHNNKGVLRGFSKGQQQVAGQENR